MTKRHLFAIVMMMCGIGHAAFLVADLPPLPALPALPSLPAMPAFPSPSNANLGAPASIAPALPPFPASSPVSVVAAPAGGSSNSLDTVMRGAGSDEARGSWWKKRHWLLKAREQQEKINGLVAQVQDAGAAYDTKRASFDRSVADFYGKNGVEVGNIDALLAQLTPYFDQANKSGVSTLDDSDTGRLRSTKDFQAYYDNTTLFAQLKSDLQSITDIDSGVSDRVAVFEQCNQQAIQKAAEAQSTVNDMFSMISHDTARDSYYKLEAMAGFLGAILKFVTNDLSSDLDKITSLGQSRMNDVGKSIASIRAAMNALQKDEISSRNDMTLTPSVQALDSSLTSSQSNSADNSVHSGDTGVSLHASSGLLNMILGYFAGVYRTLTRLFKMLF